MEKKKKRAPGVAAPPRAIFRAKRTVTASSAPASACAATAAAAAVTVTSKTESLAAGVTEPFRLRFRQPGLLLAAALPQFSLDIVGLVGRYLVCSSIKSAEDGSVQLLSKIEPAPKSDGCLAGCRAIACEPGTGNIWIADNVSVKKFSHDGEFLETFIAKAYTRSIVFEPDGDCVHISSKSDDTRVYSVRTGEALADYPPRNPFSLTMGTQHIYAVVASYECSVHTLDRGSFRFLKSRHFDEAVSAVAVVNDEAFLYCPSIRRIKVCCRCAVVHGLTGCGPDSRAEGAVY